ncbi:MAG: hypothetical protein ABI748_14425 [Dokdonella sp.]
MRHSHRFTPCTIAFTSVEFPRARKSRFYVGSVAGVQFTPTASNDNAQVDQVDQVEDVLSRNGVEGRPSL